MTNSPEPLQPADYLPPDVVTELAELEADRADADRRLRRFVQDLVDLTGLDVLTVAELLDGIVDDLEDYHFAVISHNDGDQDQ